MFNNKIIGDMRLNYLFTEHRMYQAFAVLLVLSLASCGSFQEASYYDRDGIYDSGNSRAKQQPTQKTKATAENSTYKNYFDRKSEEYALASAQMERDSIFTDIDGYSSLTEESLQEQDSTLYNINDGWGDNPQTVEINVYDNNWGWGYGFGYGFGNRYWNPYWGGRHFGFVGGCPGYYGGYGWNYGYSYYGGLYCPPFYYGGYYGYPYYNNYRYNRYRYNRNSLAYATGRRGNYTRRGITGLSSRSSSTRRVVSTSPTRRSSSYSSSRRVGVDNSTSVRRRGTTASGRSAYYNRSGNYSSTRSSNGTVRRSTGTSSRGNTVRRSSGSTRSSGYSRSSSPTRRSSSSATRSSSSRSSSSVRSSSSSSRSSGSRSSSSRSSSRRGGRG